MRQAATRRPQLYSYVVKVDKGFAPNPFGGYCTLAACTPNHLGVRVESGDWIMGNSDKRSDQRLIYAMRISEVLAFDDYFRDPRFQAKKPRKGSSWKNLCGDNIYFIGESGQYQQAFSHFHTEPHRLEQDTKHPRVFISDHFYYFGENALDTPAEFGALIRGSQGCKKDHPPEVVAGFISWLEQSFGPGILGLPRDREGGAAGACDPRLSPRSRSVVCDDC